ncbi:MAG: hypothetical protein FGM54_10530 [Chitinophagaceae bacterium]|nr:hypothetical protein [Chitinophagaceae bacterium]
MRYVNFFLIIVGSLTFQTTQAQSDTIYFHDGRKEAATIQRVSANSVGYRYFMEEADRIAGFDAIEKIVYKSGRIEAFTNKRVLRNNGDWESVKIIKDITETEGLHAVGEISVHTAFINFHTSHSGEVKAKQKLLQNADAMGCPFVFILEDKEIVYGKIKFWGFTQHKYKAIAYKYSL